MCERACESLVELHLDRLLLVVLKALLGLAIEALLAIQQIRCLVPSVAESINIEGLLNFSSLHYDGTGTLNRITNLSKAHTLLFHEVLELLLMLVTYLDNNTWVLSEQSLNNIAISADVVQIDMHTTLGIGEAHLQQRSNQTTSRNIVTSQNPTLLNHLLYSHKGVSKVFWVLNGWHIVAHLTQALGESRATKVLGVKAEVDMIDRSVLFIDKYRRHYFLDIRNFTACADDDRSRRDDLLAVGVLLTQRERVLTCRHVDMQVAAEITQGLDTCIQTGILTLLRTTGPHPVGTQAQRVHTLSQRCPDDVCQSLGHREHRTCGRISQTCLRRMTQSGGNTFHTTIVESHHTTVAQRQLNLTLTLLTGNLTCHTAVYLISQPVLTSHSLQLEYTLEVFVDLILRISDVLIMTLHGIVTHDGLRRVTKHLSHIEIEGLHTVALLEREVGITCGLTNHIQRCTLALSNLTHVFDMLLVDEQSHTLLTFIGNNLLRAQGLVADGQLGHVDLTTALLDELRQTVQVTSRAVVVDRDDGIHILLAEGTHQVVGTLLHLRVGTLYGVQFNTVRITTRINR